MNEWLAALNARLEEKRRGAAAARGVVVTPQPLAATIGAQVLRDGGNAVDAAIATALAQGIIDPFMGGIGGFGCLVVHSAEKRRSVAINYHGKAGSLARPDVFADKVIGQIHGHGERYEVRDAENQIGYRSVVVPGTVAGLEAAHRQFGRLPWHVLFEPAIGLARDGIALPGEVYARWVERTEPGHRSGWDRINATPACAALFAPEGRMLLPGQTLRQAAYGDTLERLARKGAEDFYRGEIGRAIAEDFVRHGGFFVEQDLRDYAADTTDAVSGLYRGHRILSVPLPASGGQLMQMLEMLEAFDLGAIRRLDPALYLHVVGRAMLAGFRDRALYMGDPKSVEVPVAWLASAEHRRELTELVCSDDEIRIPGLTYRESPYTTNLAVLDGEGNAVALTHTLGSASGVVVPSLGFVFNNCMYQFNPVPGTPNSIAPGKSRLSGICPTVVLRDGAPFAAMGGLGGTRILTAVMHMILNLVDHAMTPVECVEAARFHAEGPWLEMETRLSHELGGSLTERGWRVRASAYGYDRAFAVAQLAVRDAAGGFRGGSDPRGGGGIALA